MIKHYLKIICLSTLFAVNTGFGALDKINDHSFKYTSTDGYIANITINNIGKIVYAAAIQLTSYIRFLFINEDGRYFLLYEQSLYTPGGPEVESYFHNATNPPPNVELICGAANSGSETSSHVDFETFNYEVYDSGAVQIINPLFPQDPKSSGTRWHTSEIVAIKASGSSFQVTLTYPTNLPMCQWDMAHKAYSGDYTILDEANFESEPEPELESHFE